MVYLKVNCTLAFPQLGLLLSPGATTESFDHGSENVYEWMHVTIPSIPFALNISREHGWADIDDDVLDIDAGIAPEALKGLVTPGPIYIFGWDQIANDYVDALPVWLPQYIAELLLAPVNVYDRRINIDLPDPEPFAIVFPKHEPRS